jgi:HAD superfamily hydrolase (TIGR01509 family)
MARVFGTPDNAPDIEHELLDLVPRAIADKARAMRGAVSFVERVRRLLLIAVASNSPRGLLDLALERGGFAGTFPISVAADEVSAPKPAPDIYLEACRRLGVTPCQALAFEDSMTGIYAAQAAGLKVVCIPTLKELDYPADAVFACLDDPRLLAWLDRWSSEAVP